MAKPARGKELLPDDPKHGRYATYCYYKCRCAPCSLAMREYWQLKRYGLTGVQIKERVEAQGGCGSCGRTAPGSSKGWAVDHNHETGSLRGILCSNCNSALGLLGDNAEGVEKLLAYIRSWN